MSGSNPDPTHASLLSFAHEDARMYAKGIATKKERMGEIDARRGMATQGQRREHEANRKGTLGRLGQGGVFGNSWTVYIRAAANGFECICPGSRYDSCTISENQQKLRR